MMNETLNPEKFSVPESPVQKGLNAVNKMADRIGEMTLSQINKLFSGKKPLNERLDQFNQKN